MTKFIFEQDQIKINSLQLNKRNIHTFLQLLFKQFPFPQEFTIKEINSTYSDKTIRAMVFIFEKFQYLQITSPNNTIPKRYRFRHRDLNSFIDHFAKMG